jgi:hypothetical protein
VNMPLMSTSLSHIDNDQLARWGDLWGGQFASSQEEAGGLAEAFALEQSQRLWLGRFVSSDNSFVAATQAWWNFGDRFVG